MASKKTSAKRPLYVLIIEDNVHHAELLTEVLDRHFAPVVIHTVDTVKDGIEFAGQSSYDLIITGAVVRDAPMTDAIPRLARLAANAPIVVISGRGDEMLAAELIKSGATEYLVKTRETLDALPSILGTHIAASRGRRRAKAAPPLQEGPHRPTTPAAIIREVDKLTQQALAIVGPRRRRRPGIQHNIEELDRLLSQIQRLRELASKLTPRE
jgi:DNA-binding NtrC family response regulator